MLSFHNNNNAAKTATAVLILGAMLLPGIFPYIAFADAEALEETTPAVAISGDATAVTEITTTVNSTEITEDTAPDNQEPEESTVEEVNPEMVGAESMPFMDITDSPTTNITASNTASTTINATTTAESGEATASGNDAVAISGNATAVIDVLNVVNTNIVNSQGLIDFINGTLGYEDFDLRPEFEYVFIPSDTAVSTNPCAQDVCQDNRTTADINNTASIENNLTISADSGAATTAGDGSLAASGDAYASANIINLANTNITDSEYLLLVFNNFESYAGDIILPNSSFFEQLFAESPASIPHEMIISNNAIVEDDLTVESISGATAAPGTDTTAITGDSYASLVSSNLINQNLVGGTSFSILIRVQGDWTGSISGLPDGMSWRETEEGIELIYEGGGGSINPASTLSIDNSATIKNNVQVYALFGDSEASGDETLAVSGNTYANASVMNIANTNVISSNWTNLIFTIYGNWTGDLMFGQPDLWLGMQAESADEPIMPGSTVDYTFTIFNQGDATAHDITLESVFDANGLSFANGSTEAGQAHWELGDLAAKETREVHYSATVSSELDRSVITALALQGEVQAKESEPDYDNNQDTIVIHSGQKREGGSSTGVRFPAHFDISKMADKTVVQDGDTVTYTITLHNHGGQLYDAVLVDSLLDENDEPVLTQSWPLGEVKNWETINIQYEIVFDEHLEFGTYTNSAQLVGFHGSTRATQQTMYESEIASFTVQFGTNPSGKVLGMSTTNCSPYLNDYMHAGRRNNPLEVVKLQSFLNQHEGAGLPETGFFGGLTEAAVKRFQEKYQADILDPWGDSTPSGYVYYTTRKKINELSCGGLREFPLAAAEQVEILIARAHWYRQGLGI